MSTPRDHHFLPVFYLKQWTRSKDGKLFEYTVKHTNELVEKLVGPRGTGYQTDLYTFPDLPPNQAQYFEKHVLDYVDRHAAKALRMNLGIEKENWDSLTLSSWSRFILGLTLRHPDVIA